MKFCKKSWQKLEEQNRGLLSLAKKIGQNTEKFVRAALSRGEGFVDTRVVWGLLSLDKTYTKEAIDQAAGIALEMNTLSSRLVERLIKLTLQKSKIKESQNPPQHRREVATAKFIRPMSVYTEQLKSGMKSTST